MLGDVSVVSPCRDSAWYRFLHPGECLSWSNALGPESISSVMANTAPAAPLTYGAMTQNGVWAPDYAMYRTAGNENTDLAMIQAAADTQTEDNADPCSSSWYALMHGTECLKLPTINTDTLLLVGGGIAALLLLK